MKRNVKTDNTVIILTTRTETPAHYRGIDAIFFYKADMDKRAV